MTTAQTTWLETLILNAIKAQQEKGYAKRIYWWHVEMESEAVIHGISEYEKRSRVLSAFHQNKLDVMRGLQVKGLIKWTTEGNRASFTA